MCVRGCMCERTRNIRSRKREIDFSFFCRHCQTNERKKGFPRRYKSRKIVQLLEPEWIYVAVGQMCLNSNSFDTEAMI